MPRQPDHPHVVAEVLAAELGADPEVAGQLQHLLLHVRVAEGVPELGAAGRQRVQVVRRGQLGHLERVLGRHPADHDGQVVGRAGRGAQRAQLLVQEAGQPLRVQQRLGLLVQERLVGRAAALGQDQELVLRRCSRRAVQLDLRRQVGAGVALVPERRRRHLRVAQVQLVVGGEDAAGDGFLVAAAGEHGLRALADDDRGAGVLAHRQHPAGRDAGVAQQVGGHEPVVGRGLRVVDDPPQLGQVGRAQQVLDVVHGLVHQRGDGGRVDLQEGPAGGLDRPAGTQVETAVLGVVRAEWEDVGVVELGHRSNLTAASTRSGNRPDLRIGVGKAGSRTGPDRSDPPAECAPAGRPRRVVRGPSSRGMCRRFLLPRRPSNAGRTRRPRPA